MTPMITMTLFLVIRTVLNLVFSTKNNVNVLLCGFVAGLVKIKPPKEVPKPPVTSPNNSNPASSNKPHNFSSPKDPMTTNTTASLPNNLTDMAKKNFYTDNLKTSVLKDTDIHKAVPLSALEKENSVAVVPWTPNCPSHMPMQNYSDFCNLAAGIKCLEEGKNIKDVVPVMSLARGNAGENITTLSAIRRGVPELKETVPFDHHFSAEDLETLDKSLILDLRNISLKTMVMLPWEIWSMFQVNKELKNNSLQITREMEVKGKANFTNFTPNNHPDYALVPLNENYKTTTENVVCFDLKIAKHPFYGKNILLGVTDNQEKILLLLHEKLTLHLKAKIVDLPINEKRTANSIINLLDNNLAYFQHSKDITNFKINYNVLYDKYKTFFVEHCIGFNLVVDLSLNKFTIEEATKKLFFHYYAQSHSNPHSEVSQYVKNIPENNPLTKGEHYSYLINFYKEVLSKK